MLFRQSTSGTQQQSILIADDDQTISELLAEVFRRYGFTVFMADNGLQAWELFNSHPIDFVLTDLKMPGLDGSELSRRIRDRCPPIKIALMTGGNTDIASALLNEGVIDSFLLKPFKLEKVFEFIK